MQLHKFYGRTVHGTLARVKRAFGPDALILETRPLEPSSAAARLNPGARFEVVAVRDPASPDVPPQPAAFAEPTSGSARPASPAAVGGRDFLEDLGLLRDQVRRLLEADPDAKSPDAPHVDLGDYHALIRQGVDHETLAPSLRRWLQWRTASAPIRRYLAQIDAAGPAAHMTGENLREWLLLTWLRNQGLPLGDVDESPRPAPRMVGLVGPTGVGKTTTLAKLASIYRHKNRQNIAVFTLDTLRFGAVDQWRRCSKLMGFPVHEIVSPEELRRSMESWDRFDWIGIDTPGGMTPQSEVGVRYGDVLAHCPHLETFLVLPATQQESVSREHMDRGRSFGASKVVFSKLDEATRPGSLLNLTLDGTWKIDCLTTGPRIPEDLEPASRRTLWRRILAPGVNGAMVGGMA